MSKLTDEEKKLRAKEAAKAKREFMKQFQPKVYREKILDGRASFKSWYESGSEQYPRDFSTNSYPRREEQLAYKRDPENKKRNRIKEAEWVSRNREYVNFRSRATYRGLFVDKKLWDSFHRLTSEEQAEVLKVNPEAPAILRPKGLVLRRVVRPRQLWGEVSEE